MSSRRGYDDLDRDGDDWDEPRSKRRDDGEEERRGLISSEIDVHEPSDELLEMGYHQRLWNRFVAYCFSVNYIIGIGVLSLPFAFSKTGVILSSFTLLIISFMMAISALWIVEVCARAEGIISEEGQGHMLRSVPWFRVTLRKFEVNQLCRIFVGRVYQRVYEVFLTLSLYGGLWSYTSVGISSLIMTVPIPGLADHKQCDFYGGGWSQDCEHAFMVWLVVIGVVLVFLSCLDFVEQVPLQITLTLFRFTALAIMLVSVTYAMFTEPAFEKDKGGGAPYISGTNMANMAYFYRIVGIVTYAQVVHHSVPGIVQPAADKMKIKSVFIMAYSTTTFLYFSVGLVLYLYFGNTVKPLSTLNWAHFPGIPANEPTPAWALALSQVVMLFPVFDIISVFPLTAITLAHNLQSGVPSRWRKSLGPFWFKITFRLIAAVPPLIGIIFVRNLATLLEVSGTVTIFVAFITPAVLQYASKRMCVNRYGPTYEETPYSWHFSNNFYVAIVFITGICLFITNLGMMIEEHAAGTYNAEPHRKTMMIA